MASNIEHNAAGVLSAAKVIADTGDATNQYRNIQWHTSRVKVRLFIPAEEYMDIVHGVLDDCLTEDGTMAYELVDFSIRLHIINAYALVELPEDFEQLYEIAYYSGLYEQICTVANKAQIESIYSAVQRYIDTM